MSFNALNIDFYLCGGIHSKGYAPGEQTTALLQELTAILDRLKSDDYEPNLHTIWLSAKRPTFRQYYEQYYPETPYDTVDAETEKNARRAYTIAYPCAEVWYQMSTNHFPGENGQEVYVLCLNDVKAFGTKIRLIAGVVRTRSCFAGRWRGQGNSFPPWNGALIRRNF